MTAAMLLHVGDDFCHRIPVMEQAGLIVSCSRSSVSDLRRALRPGSRYAAITFHNDIDPVSNEVVLTARKSSRSPIVFFENPSVAFDERAFDLVIRNLVPPAMWLAKLMETIEESRRIQELSRQLRADSASIRYQSQILRRRVVRDRARVVDLDNVWRRETG